MRRPDPSDAELLPWPRTPRTSRRELEKLLDRAKRAIEAFATSDQTAAERSVARAKVPKPARLLPAT